ncbi:hypothetical protein VKT23_008916 [Stygiomarasmius scandens]
MLRQIKVFFFNRVTGNSLTPEQVETYENEINGSIQAVTSPIPAEMSTTSTNTEQVTMSPSAGETSQAPTPNSEEPQILTFAQIRALIESGNIDQIPNNKQIPENLNEATPSQSATPTRKKPWEAIA